VFHLAAMFETGMAFKVCPWLFLVEVLVVDFGLCACLCWTSLGRH
jgi:hypothetical protein